MAKKPSTKSSAVYVHDMGEHESTYAAFMSLMRFSVIAMIFIVVALYCFIAAEQPLLGWLLVLSAAPAAFVLNRLMGTSSGH